MIFPDTKQFFSAITIQDRESFQSPNGLRFYIRSYSYEVTLSQYKKGLAMGHKTLFRLGRIV